MNYWCESCARKNLCYVVDDRPKCFVPITSNDRTADRKTEPQTEDKHAVCTGCDYYDLPNAFHPCASCVDFSKYKPKIEDEPQTDRVETMSCQECKWWFTDSLKHGGYCQSLLYNHECRYEPTYDIDDGSM